MEIIVGDLRAAFRCKLGHHAPPELIHKLKHGILIVVKDEGMGKVSHYCTVKSQAGP